MCNSFNGICFFVSPHAKENESYGLQHCVRVAFPLLGHFCITCLQNDIMREKTVAFGSDFFVASGSNRRVDLDVSVVAKWISCNVPCHSGFRHPPIFLFLSRLQLTNMHDVIICAYKERENELLDRSILKQSSLR